MFEGLTEINNSSICCIQVKAIGWETSQTADQWDMRGEVVCLARQFLLNIRKRIIISSIDVHKPDLLWNNPEHSY